jgi:hypothetical protein
MHITHLPIKSAANGLMPNGVAEHDLSQELNLYLQFVGFEKLKNHKTKNYINHEVKILLEKITSSDLSLLNRLISGYLYSYVININCLLKNKLPNREISAKLENNIKIRTDAKFTEYLMSSRDRVILKRLKENYRDIEYFDAPYQKMIARLFVSEYRAESTEKLFRYHRTLMEWMLSATAETPDALIRQKEAQMKLIPDLIDLSRPLSIEKK